MADTSFLRISKMLEGRRAVRVMQFPSIDADEMVADIGVRILTEEDIDACHLEAIQYIRAKAKTLNLETADVMDVDPEILDRERIRGIVWKAFVQPAPDEHGKYTPFFPSMRAVRQLDTVIVKTLFDIYLDHQNYVSPLLCGNPDEIKELADALGKGLSSAVILSHYDAPTLRTLLHFMAAELRTSRGPSSSTGSQEDAI